MIPELQWAGAVRARCPPPRAGDGASNPEGAPALCKNSGRSCESSAKALAAGGRSAVPSRHFSLLPRETFRMNRRSFLEHSRLVRCGLQGWTEKDSGSRQCCAAG